MATFRNSLLNIIGEAFGDCPVRKSLFALEYLIREFDEYGTLDAINMVHAREAAIALKLAISLADNLPRDTGSVAALKQAAE